MMARDWIGNRKLMLASGCTIVLALYFLGTNSATSTAPNVPPQSASTTTAIADFAETMSLGEQAGLIASYHFTDTERVIYVTDVWSAMTVDFKKDFLAKVALLRQSIDGHHYFEVRDAHSNEKVGEVTAFSSSLEVYR